MIYFDNSATTPLAPQVTEVLVNYMNTSFANPSSRHALGLEAAKIVSSARTKVAKALGCSAGEVYFASGGTECDNIAILGGANIKKGKRVVTTAVEHHAVLNTMKHLESLGFEVVYIKPDKTGHISLDAIAQAINSDTCLVSVMHVNNETGAIFPVDKIKPIMKKIALRALLHVDAVQSFGHIPFKPAVWGIDLASISSHKIHGPKGIGALYVRKGVSLKPTVFGGGQENNLRSGTENVGAIAGFGKAAELINYQEASDVQKIKDKLLKALLTIDGAVQNGKNENESPYILNISFGKVRSEIMLNALSNEGIYVSSGSACASNSHGSHVLDAMEAPLPDSAIRFSLSRYNTLEEADIVIDKLIEIEKGLRR